MRGAIPDRPASPGAHQGAAPRQLRLDTPRLVVYGEDSTRERLQRRQVVHHHPGNPRLSGLPASGHRRRAPALSSHPPAANLSQLPLLFFGFEPVRHGECPLSREEAEQLERKLQHVTEPSMRRELVLEALEARSAEDCFALVHAALHQPAVEARSLELLRETVLTVLAQGGATRPLPYELLEELYAAATEHGDDLLKRLLRTPNPEQSTASPAEALPREVSEIPLGVRRSLAKGTEKHLLERLLLDPDLLVIRHLLDNPRITEDDVIRIASRRPIPGSTLNEVAKTRRWASRRNVRVALARNPHCPTDVALRVLGSLPLRELRELRDDTTLPSEIRRHADEELARRDRA